MQTTYSHYLTDASPRGAIAELTQALLLVPRLLTLGDFAASAPTAPGKWSRKEILGHLIDSASNNLQRFVRAQIPAHLTDGVLRLPSYAQDDWVHVQGYSARPWEELVTLWSVLNRHIVFVLERIDSGKLGTCCVIGQNPPLRLDHLVVDYVGHLKHHMGQILKSVKS
jgi:hypothetical protein